MFYAWGENHVVPIESARFPSLGVDLARKAEKCEPHIVGTNPPCLLPG